eukprot:15324811-Ditylum_brightwellii.AAC.1
MDKSKDNKHDQLPNSEGRHLDRPGHKETLQAGDIIRYIKADGVGGRKVTNLEHQLKVEITSMFG